MTSKAQTTKTIPLDVRVQPFDDQIFPEPGETFVSTPQIEAQVSAFTSDRRVNVDALNRLYDLVIAPIADRSRSFRNDDLLEHGARQLRTGQPTGQQIGGRRRCVR